MAIKPMKDLDLSGKTVVVREDLNVPMKDGKISNDKRIRAVSAVLDRSLNAHLGRFVGDFRSGDIGP